MIIDGNIYNYLNTNLVPKKRTTAHKSSELRAVYNSMARYNKNSPLFLLSLSESKQSYMIDIKEAALTLKDASESFSNSDSNIYSQKTIHSDNEDSISGTIKSSNFRDLPDELSIKVDTLASGQVNIGNFLPADRRALQAGRHQFSMQTPDTTANFSINIGEGDTNLDVQKKLVQYINNRDLGVQASLVTEHGENAISLASTGTGLSSGTDGLHFTFNDSLSGPDIVSTLGLNNVTTSPSNSSFTVNGEAHTAASNHISINRVIELDFHSVSNDPVTISFIPDTNAVMDQIDAFVDAYNSLVDLSQTSATANVGTRNLFNDISGIVNNHKSELEAAGLNIEETNKISKNDALLAQSIKSGQFSELFNDISSFKDDIAKATNRLTLDPMAYINKLIVAYPNSKNKFSTPYHQSIYSGLIYNNYA